MIAIAGIPGAGKSTVGRLVAESLNLIQSRNTCTENDGTFAINVPMDGFHYSRAHLATMPNPEEAIHRRGAAFTYDAEAYCDLVRILRRESASQSLNSNGSYDHSFEETVFAPSFDHALKDPVPGDIAIRSHSKIIIFEGNYCALDRAPWSDAAKMMDELWFVSVGRDVAANRLIQRHVASGICPDEDTARHRVHSTDLLNADDVMANRLPVQEMICEHV